MRAVSPVSPPSGATSSGEPPSAWTARATQGPWPPTLSTTSGRGRVSAYSKVHTSTGAGAKTATRGGLPEPPAASLIVPPISWWRPARQGYPWRRAGTPDRRRPPGPPGRPRGQDVEPAAPPSSSGQAHGVVEHGLDAGRGAGAGRRQPVRSGPGRFHRLGVALELRFGARRPHHQPDSVAPQDDDLRGRQAGAGA